MNNLSNYVNDSVKLGDEIEDAIRQSMKAYRSSKYRFPDDMVEETVRSNCMTQLQALPVSSPSGVPAVGVMEEDDRGASSEDEEMKESDIEESDHWIQGTNVDHNKGGLHRALDIPAGKNIPKSKISAATHSENPHIRHMAQFAKNVAHESSVEEDNFGHEGKRSSALGGYSAEVPDTDRARHALNVLDNPALSLANNDDTDEVVPMIRDKNGRMVPDPFAAQAAARRKGIVMKEQQNLIKKLRTLLETEVSQAEVMMAAKGFAQELQEMVEKIGRLQNEDLPPVTDQMRETYGMESASAFQTQIYGALQSVMDALYTAKTQVDDAVGNMASTGQVSASIDMDKDLSGVDDMAADDDLDAELDLDNLDADLGTGEPDEFGGAEIEDPLGHEKKLESAQNLRRKIEEMQRIVAKAKKLRESSR